MTDPNDSKNVDPDGDNQPEFDQTRPHSDWESAGVNDETLGVSNTPGPDSNFEPTFFPSQAIDSSLVKIGSSIGPYRLIEVIGEGGMGQVFKAEQLEPVHRFVAVKVIKAGMDSKQVIARFEAERQALALMDHPNIARVLDASSTPSGHPYFVMELVSGQPINQFCDANHFNPRQRLELFMQVCLAVQHAHQKGIIHRDIKPSNVLVAMVDGEPQAKVIDFGLAKATDQRLTEATLFTAVGQFVGTPSYMSPEQADLTSVDIDTRTDVYSLGVLLYELLTGVTPLDLAQLRKAGYGEIQRLIREQDPPRMSLRLSSVGGDSSLAAENRSTNPRSLLQLLRGDLDVIVMKALEKDRARRYDTPVSFAEDIQRFLNHEVIQARPASRAYRINRFVQRNRLGVTATGLVAASLIVGTIVSATQANRASIAERLAVSRLGQVEAEQKKTQQALMETQTERDRAILAEAKAAKEAATTSAINEFLKYDLLAEAAPAKNPRNKQITVEELVAKAAASIGEKFKDEPLVQADLRSTIGETLAALGNLPDSEEQFALALKIMMEHLGEKDPDTIMGINNLGLLQKFQGKYDDAEKNYLRALELHRKVHGDQHEATLGTINNLAMLYSTQGKYELAEPLFLETLAGSRKTLGDDHPDTLQSMNNLAALYRSMQKFDEAEALFKESLETRTRVLGSEHPDTLTTMANLALWLQDRKQFDKAEELLKQTVEISSRVSGPEHFVTLINKNNLGHLYKLMKRYELAEPILVEVLDARRRVLGEEHAHTLGNMLSLANLYQETDRFEKGEPLYRERAEIIKQQSGAQSLEYSKALSSFGEELLRQKKYSDATDTLRECLSVQKDADANPLQIADVQSLLGEALAGKAAEAAESDPEASVALSAEAESLLLSGYEALAASDFGKTEDGKTIVASALGRIVNFYAVRDQEGDAEKAATWKSKQRPVP